MYPGRYVKKLAAYRAESRAPVGVLVPDVCKGICLTAVHNDETVSFFGIIRDDEEIATLAGVGIFVRDCIDKTSCALPLFPVVCDLFPALGTA